MGVVDAVAVSVGHDPAALVRALGLVHPQDRDLGVGGIRRGRGTTQNLQTLVLGRKRKTHNEPK